MVVVVVVAVVPPVVDSVDSPDTSSSDGSLPLQDAHLAGTLDLLYQPDAVDVQPSPAKSPVSVQYVALTTLSVYCSNDFDARFL